MAWARCKYCGKQMNDPCSVSAAANSCDNAHPDVQYVDKTLVKVLHRLRAMKEREARRAPFPVLPKDLENGEKT